MALVKVLSAWGARLTRAAQREHAAQIIRSVEKHKAADAFISSSLPTVYGPSSSLPTVQGPSGLGPGLVSIWPEISQVVKGIGNRGFIITGGVNGRGPAG